MRPATCPDAAGAGGQLLDADGRPQIGFMVRQLPTATALALEALLLNRIWPNNPVNRRYRGLDLRLQLAFRGGAAGRGFSHGAPGCMAGIGRFR